MNFKIQPGGNQQQVVCKPGIRLFKKQTLITFIFHPIIMKLCQVMAFDNRKQLQ